MHVSELSCMCCGCFVKYTMMCFRGGGGVCVGGGDHWEGISSNKTKTEMVIFSPSFSKNFLFSHCTCHLSEMFIFIVCLGVGQNVCDSVCPLYRAD